MLGILLMNIVGFAYPYPVYSDPSLMGGDHGLNLIAYAFNLMLVDGKIRGVFTLLFGASMYLQLSRAESSGRAGNAADVYYRRNLWLMAIGIVHAYLLWYGEILYPYALLGLVLFPFRKLSWRQLTAIFVLFVGATFALNLRGAIATRHTHDLAVEAQRLQAAGGTPTPEQWQQLDKWQHRVEELKPAPSQLKAAVDQNRGSFLGAVRYRAAMLAHWHSTPFYSPATWDLLSMMLLGIALVKAGVLCGERSIGFYLKSAAVFYALGLPLQAAQLWLLLRHRFDIVDQFTGFVIHDPARILICLAHVSLGIAAVKSGYFPRMVHTLAATGRMALTNYIMQSVICTVLFTGFGLYAVPQRYQLLLLVVAVWALQLAWSPYWLSRYRYGPLEWLWRSLTYWKWQPLRIQPQRAITTAVETPSPAPLAPQEQ